MAGVSRLLESRALRPLKDKVLLPAGEGVGRVVLERMVQHARVDPSIRYPCYKSFDDLIDVERLKSLDAYVTSKIEEHKEERDEKFYAGLMTLKATSPKVPGSRNIYCPDAMPCVAAFWSISIWTSPITGLSPMRLTSFHCSWTSLPRCLSKPQPG